MPIPETGMKRALFVLSQPPGTAGVQAARWSKMLPYLQDSQWSIHFVGPDPAINSVLFDDVKLDGHVCRFTRNLPYSRQFAVKRNRRRRSSPMFWIYASLQVVSRCWERLFRLNENMILADGLLATGRQACAEFAFDLVCAASPPFFFLELARQLALAEDLPYLVLYDDPHAARDVGQFWPSEPEEQRRVLADADCVVFASPLTRERYVAEGLVSENQSVWVTDSYPRLSQLHSLASNDSRHPCEGTQLVHLGNLPPWRNIDNLLRVLHSFALSQGGGTPIHLSIYGFLYPEALARVNGDPLLCPLVSQMPAVSLQQSHEVAASADILLIVIGTRHADNVPSKTFEYMVHPKPLMVVGPQGNPLQNLLAEIPIGVFCNIESSDDIHAGLQALISHRSEFVDAYTTHAAEVERFSAESVAQRWISYFDQAIATHRHH
jgi:glycosyltransferase involved in cell wall biosynthesis